MNQGEMENKIINGFEDLSLYEKLKKIEANLTEINMLIDSLEIEKNRNRDSLFLVKRFIDIKKLKKVESRIQRFLRFPLRDPRPGRPVEYPESDHEKKKYKRYRQDGFSIRQIAKSEKMSADTVFRKLKKYQIQ
jgi:hypothetical protein